MPREAAGTAMESIAALAAHDPGAWQALFDRYYRKMYSFALVRTGDVHAAEEVDVEVFVAAAKGIGRYRQTGAPFAAWLYRIARNVTADHLNWRRRRPVVPLDGIDIAARAGCRGRGCCGYRQRPVAAYRRPARLDRPALLQRLLAAGGGDGAGQEHQRDKGTAESRRGRLLRRHLMAGGWSQ